MPSAGNLPLYKRGDIWWARVRDRRGRVVRKSTKCRDYRAAALAYADLELQGVSPAHAAASSATIEGCVNDYLEDLVARQKSASTIRKETTKSGHFLRIWKSDMPMAGIDRVLVANYIKDRERDVSHHTVSMELGTLRRVLKIADHFGKLSRPIAQILPPNYGPRHTPRKRWLPPDELGKLIAQLTPGRAAHVAFFVATGARLGEAERARRGDVDEAKGLVSLRGTKTKASAGDVPITDVTREVLAFALKYSPGEDLLFNPWGKLHRDLEVACRRAGIAKCTPNDLRRTHGHWYRGAGLLPADIAPLLRHTTDKLAQTTYAAPVGEELAKLVEVKLRATGLVSDSYAEVGTEDKKRPQLTLVPGVGRRGTAEKKGLKQGAPGKSRTCGQRFRKALQLYAQTPLLVEERHDVTGSIVPILTGGCPECDGTGEIVVIDHGSRAATSCSSCLARAS